MKLKTLKKKIRRLETRLLEGPKKLAKLKVKLGALVKANAAKSRKKAAAKAAATRKRTAAQQQNLRQNRQAQRDSPRRKRRGNLISRQNVVSNSRLR